MTVNQTTSPHEGIAPGAKKIDKATLVAALGRFLARSAKHEVVRQGKTVVVDRHETDPPEGYAPYGNQPRIGALPALVKVEDLGASARVEDHEHSLAIPSESHEHVIYHMLRVIVGEARRIGAKGVAIREVHDDGVSLVVVATNAL